MGHWQDILRQITTIMDDTETMKKYAIVIDISPSEQIGDNDDQILCSGVLFGLKSPESFNQVGNQYPDSNKRLNLRKYSGSSNAYKNNLRQHLKDIKETDHVLASASVVNQRYIKRVGIKVWEKAHGKLLNPYGYNKKGKPRHQLGGYKIDGVAIDPYLVLEDDLCIIGWLVSEIALLHKKVNDINNEVVKLDILMDRLPNDQGSRGLNKAELLKWTLEKLSESTVHVAGVPDTPDFYQRDILADNIAGLCRDIMDNDPQGGVSEINDLLSMTKFSLPRN